MKNVIVLRDNKQKESIFLKDLGIIIINPISTMCLVQLPTKIFNFQIFGILIQDKKLTDFIKTKDGIIILLDFEKINNNILDCVKKIIVGCSEKPLLIIFEKYDDSKINYNSIQTLKPFIMNIFNRKTVMIHYKDKNYLKKSQTAKNW